MMILADAAAWRSWLDGHHDSMTEAWLVLAKKGTNDLTSLTYEQALQEALCYGWIDGMARRRDESTYCQRFSPRRRRSPWSQPNVVRVERLRREGRMHPAGLAAFERAEAEGRLPAPSGG
ncbi:YdeI/OmpD-associated family protein [Nonomuraea jabiensis]|uniref:YdeI/OmpD-associated family protein n=1 Tax=Nonomuraea jabiensis TaxID=882448 RepID=UPI003685AA9E